MDQLLLHFFLHFFHIFLSAPSVKVELMVMFRDTELAANAFATKLADTNDFLREVVLGTFENAIHCHHNYKTSNHSIS
jgi:hypothetical protein